ncbi:hypothetical protein INR79_14940 [Vibrio sp. SCSIO 43132]|uniref:hypothetical protein n=1 Tax=Vibrio sp. SCSIO 43132 TaxID=2779363 RepID=UPI001CA9819B|nr:hypothetical protein [Vibrio sp. SCSIO 43132]UAB69796.1 hypothetical protein INR79_14940 [Vibrio sp. SCSIO 43132]
MAKEFSTFDSRQPQKQCCPKKTKSKFRRLNASGVNFEYTLTQDDSPINLIKKLKPSEIKNSNVEFWDEKNLLTSDFINIYQVVYYLYLFSKTAVLVFFPIVFMLSLWGSLFKPFREGLDIFIDINLMGVNYILIPFSVIWGGHY